jgi:hypothetical protein
VVVKHYCAADGCAVSVPCPSRFFAKLRRSLLGTFREPEIGSYCDSVQRLPEAFRAHVVRARIHVLS